jgi:hypothetical protein
VAGTSDAAIGTRAQRPPPRAQGMSLLFNMRTLHPDWQTAVMATSREFLAKHPVAVKAFIKGFMRATRPSSWPRAGRPSW